MKRFKFYSVIIAVCVLLTSCNAKDGASSCTATDEHYEVTSSSVQVTAVPETAVSVTTAFETTVPKTTVLETTVPETTVSETTVSETTIPENTVPEEPKWNEEKIEDSLYITVDCYERLSAYVGAPAGSLLKIGNKISVIAITDTGYYKMENGRYIHKDYTGKTKPSESVQPVAGSFESEINKITLKAARTNNKVLDDLVDKILAKIITKDMSNSQKLKAVYDYIISNSTYAGGIFMYDDMINFSGDNAYLSEYDMETVYFAYQILSKGKGVCDNYSSAFTVLTRAIGFESYSTSGGVAYSGGGYTGHRWNNIKVGNTWYEFDSQIEDKYNELNGYTSYMFYGRVRNSNPDLYIYPENENLYIESYKDFKFADPLIVDVTITAGNQKLKRHYEQQKANAKFCSSADSTDDYIDYENTKVPELTVTLSAKGGTAPYSYKIVVYQYVNGALNKYLCDERKFDSNDKSMSYKLQLPDLGEYTVEYMISDSSAREIYKDAMVFVSDNSPLKGELKIEKETREEYLDCGNVCATFTYTGGGRIVNTYSYAIDKDYNELFCVQGYSQGKCEYWYDFVKGEEYEIFVIATDSDEQEHTFSQKYTYIT